MAALAGGFVNPLSAFGRVSRERWRTVCTLRRHFTAIPGNGYDAWLPTLYSLLQPTESPVPTL
eukprot:6158648-Prymnesium_polylepis.1